MRKFSAIVAVIALIGATLLFASDSWEGYYMVLTAENGGQTGDAYLEYPHLLVGESATMNLTVEFEESEYREDSDIITGPCPPGTLTLSKSARGLDVVFVEARAFCTRYDTLSPFPIVTKNLYDIAD